MWQFSEKLFGLIFFNIIIFTIFVNGKDDTEIMIYVL